MNKIVKGGIIGLGALAVMETVFAMGKGHALGVTKYVERNSDMDCEEFVNEFTAKATEYDLSKRDEKEES